jgi:uncharacterized protein
MRHTMLFAFVFLAVVTPWWPTIAQNDPDNRPTFARDSLVIETQSGRALNFDVELATTPHERAYGLMFVESLPTDQGMLFLFEEAAPRNFWMRNTLISLDMIFISDDGEIINIAERAIPGDERPGQYGSDGPASAVLEINGGLSALIGIRPGDRVIHPGVGEHVD